MIPENNPAVFLFQLNLCREMSKDNQYQKGAYRLKSSGLMSPNLIFGSLVCENVQTVIIIQLNSCNSVEKHK